MAKPKRKVPKGKPITQHQLFPAVVALWFGALFGLGSLAVRPTLIEELVIKSRIDLLIPAAAPPLGMTARMLIALLMAALGASIGIWIARRLARPRQEVRERKRTNLSTRDEGASGGVFNSYADASTRNPGPAEGDAAAPGVLAGRRRSLAIEHEVDDFVPHDMAPLPGGAPQIFDIAAAGLNDGPGASAAMPELGSYAEAPPLQAAAPGPTPVALDWANATPVLAPAAVVAPAPLPQLSAEPPPVFERAPPPILPAPEDNRQVFGQAAPATPPIDQPRQIFGAPVIEDHVPREFVEAHGFRSSVFEAPEPSPLFPARTETLPAELEPAPAVPGFAIPEALVAPVEPPQPAAPLAQAEPEPPQPNPASLGIEDLSARLAESMRRRRAGRTDPVAPALPEPAAAAEAPPVTAPQAAATAPTAQPFELPVNAPEAAAATVPAFSVPPFVVPPFTVPAAEQSPETVAALAPVAAHEAPQPIPAALRPLDLTGFEEFDHAEQDSLLPPRRIAFPVETVTPAANEPELPAALAPVSVALVEDEPEAALEEAVAEENYASLLAVTPSPTVVRNPFVRVEEPEVEAELEAIEPVVIFPGQAVPPPQVFARPAAIGGDAGAAFRRFDAPASAGQGQLSAVNEAANAMPSEEAERALRSALANLQRMSGAA